MKPSGESNTQELFVSGHRACHGCGMALSVRHILKATGKEVIVVTPTGCLETFTSPYGYSPWRVPWIHHVFENAPSIAAGIAAALKAQGRDYIRVLVIGGDGATFDIGFGALSGMLERGDDVLYICVDNGAYMNTGGQRSGASPMFSSTTTDPAGTRSLGKLEMKKDLPVIIAAHGVPYVATASAAYIKDLEKKVKKAMQYHGPRYIQIDTPCPTVWGFPPDRTLEVGRLGVQTGLVPLFEMENGNITSVHRIKNRVPVEEYLRAQKRYRHLFSSDRGRQAIEKIQAQADENIKRFGLLKHSGNKGQ
ncbi:MAG: pyruvate ferredoxin oxidoreductase [Deltaproteobacteria bacterium]|nr:pyruvate ferredoxin oxidoreductase [Deltaproteobacteria bacterium]MBW1930205.1 pyruvate ferredoxin oxidoreductase [Deltaproteobacteria bacterium]